MRRFSPLMGRNNDHVRSPPTFNNPHCKDFLRLFVPEVSHTFLTRFGVHRNAQRSPPRSDVYRTLERGVENESLRSSHHFTRKKTNNSNKRDDSLVRPPKMNRIPSREEIDKRDETEKRRWLRYRRNTRYERKLFRTLQ
jgi:hypothetical protein